MSAVAHSLFPSVHSQIPAILELQIVDPILIIDNCKIHHNPQVLALLIDAGIEVIFLPPYSPKYNPIEEAFSKFKAFIRRHGKLFREGGMTDYAIIGHAFDSITAENADNWIRHAQYT